MPSTPNESKPEPPILAPPPPPAESGHAMNRGASDVDQESERDEANARSANERSANESVRKPQRVAQRKPAARPTPPRRRPQPSQPTARAEDHADWEFNLASKVPPGGKPSFEVGSNNAPILD